MNRRGVLLAVLGLCVALPAAAAERPQPRRAAGSEGTASQSKPGLAERANRRIGKSTEGRTAGKAKGKANAGDDAINKLVRGRRR